MEPNLSNAMHPNSPDSEHTTDLPPSAIAERAYALFLARGKSHGDDLADWFQAEAELRGARVQDQA